MLQLNLPITCLGTWNFNLSTLFHKSGIGCSHSQFIKHPFNISRKGWLHSTASLEYRILFLKFEWLSANTFRLKHLCANCWGFRLWIVVKFNYPASVSVAIFIFIISVFLISSEQVSYEWEQKNSFVKTDAAGHSWSEMSCLLAFIFHFISLSLFFFLFGVEYI